MLPGVQLLPTRGPHPGHQCSFRPLVGCNTRQRTRSGPHTQQQEQRTSSRLQAASSSSSSSNSSPESELSAHFLPLGDGDAIRLPLGRPEAGPRYEYSKDEAIQVQLQALQQNDKPYPDHGIEVLYRYANFDPFQRSKYFGKSFDLGQFERFRRIIHIPAYKPLLNHEEVTILSTLQLSDRMCRTRMHVVGPYRKDEGVFELTMVQRLGGRYDGYWFTESLTADGNDWKQSIISF